MSLSPDIRQRRNNAPGNPAHRHNGHADREVNGVAHDHGHSHSHSLFHSHSHDEHSHHAEAGKVLNALRGKGDRGSWITLVGLLTNIALTAGKGAAGWYLNSASLIADAAHSLSDLLGDFVTLFCWQYSQQAPSDDYPYGYGKFETLGTTTVSMILVAGAFGIGLHSYSLLITAIMPPIHYLSPGLLRDTLTYITHLSTSGAAHAHSHSHSHEDMDPNAAWCAALSILVKEWLYRETKKVAEAEGSSILMANALHHRSDAFASIVAVLAILGSWVFPSLPLDPLGGLVVASLILFQGISLFRGALGELTDAGVSSEVRQVYSELLLPLTSEDSFISFSDLRAVRSGALVFVDMTAVVPSNMTVAEMEAVEAGVRERLTSQRPEVKVVRIHFVGKGKQKD